MQVMVQVGGWRLCRKHGRNSKLCSDDHHPSILKVGKSCHDKSSPSGGKKGSEKHDEGLGAKGVDDLSADGDAQ
jgi:hypothetical protein